MTSSSSRRLGLVAAVAMLVAGGCTTAESGVLDGLVPPPSVTVTPLGTTAIRVDWEVGPLAQLDLYRIERRTNFDGPFVEVVTLDPNLGTYFDTRLEPETFYGYRIRSVSREGERSRPSTVAGGRTAARPGLLITTNLESGTSAAVGDPNGYRVQITGPVDTVVTVGTIDQRILAPLPAGQYSLVLEDVLSTCTITNGLTRTIVVVDTGLFTRSATNFGAVCVDPNRGRLVTQVAVTGDSVDLDGYRLDYAGILPGGVDPVTGGTIIEGTGGTANFNALLPGDYQVQLSDVDPPCSISGPSTADVQVAALSLDSLTFRVTCPDKNTGNPGAPIQVVQAWSPPSSANGQTVEFLVSIDRSGAPTATVGVLQANFEYDPSVLTFVSAAAQAGSVFGPPTVNSSTPGLLTWLVISAVQTQPAGLLPVARFTFTVNGSAGQTTATRSAIEQIYDLTGTIDLLDQSGIVEDTFTVSAGGGGGNQAPTAEANGPYTGTAGTAISFSSAGSTDPDGTIASFNWSFSDGTTSTQANPSKSFATAGSYTATLTVTDNQGGTDSDQAGVTVTSGGGGGNQAPTAEANGPYTGTAGTAISFSSAGSSDPDGTIASFSWSFSDGTTSTQASPSKSFATAGSYTATLTVTDNQGGTASDQASVTVTGGGGGSSPFTWVNAFGPLEPVPGTIPMTITLNLTQDIPQTSGAEALGQYFVDSLRWDPAVLEYHSLTYGSGGGSFNTTDAVGGCKCKLVFSGLPTSPLNSGVVTVAIVRFKPKGASGATTTTVTGLGPVLSTNALGAFNYRSLITVVEGTLTLP